MTTYVGNSAKLAYVKIWQYWKWSSIFRNTLKVVTWEKDEYNCEGLNLKKTKGQNFLKVNCRRPQKSRKESL